MSDADARSIPLSLILKHITTEVYDYYHGFGPATPVLDVVPLMDALADYLQISRDELGTMFDVVREEVHGVKFIRKQDGRL